MNIQARQHRRIRANKVQFLYYSDGTTIVRKGVLDGEYVIQLRDENNLFPIPDFMPQYYFYTDGATLYRDGVRDGIYVVDKALTELGFDGTINVDWELAFGYM